MNRLLRMLAIATAVAGLLTSNPVAAQILPPLKKAARVKIIKAPELEISTDFLTIVRWTTNNPGGSDVHNGIVHYGTDPKDLSQIAKSPLQVEPRPSIHGFPGAHRGSHAADDVLLPSRLGGEQRHERSGEEQSP